MTNLDRWQSYRRNRDALVSAAVMLFLILAAAAGPPLLYLYNHCSYDTQDFDNRLQPPTWQHLLGTDTLGRDILVRVLYGARVSLLVGLVGTLVSLVIGVSYGAMAGYLGGWID